MDRFTRGFIIGIVSNTVKDILAYLNYYFLHFTKATYAHLMGIYLLGRPVRTTLELIYAQTVEFAFGGVVGTAFIYYAYRTKNKKNLWFKGIIAANGVYFLTYVFGTFFRLPVLRNPFIGTAISNLITTTIFGILMGMATYWWGKKIGDFEESRQPEKIVQLAPRVEKGVEGDDRPKIKLKRPIKLK